MNWRNLSDWAGWDDGPRPPKRDDQTVADSNRKKKVKVHFKLTGCIEVNLPMQEERREIFLHTDDTEIRLGIAQELLKGIPKDTLMKLLDGRVLADNVEIVER